MAFLEQPGSRLRALGIVVLLAVLGGLGWAVLRPRPSGPAAPEIRVPEPNGITVEVLNGSNRPGLARTVTRYLRARGFDVMFFGTTRDSVRATEVLLRRGDSTAALKVAQALGLAGIRVAIDTLLRLDVTVRLGQDFRQVAR